MTSHTIYSDTSRETYTVSEDGLRVVIEYTTIHRPGKSVDSAPIDIARMYYRWRIQDGWSTSPREVAPPNMAQEEEDLLRDIHAAAGEPYGY
jgi:hypothetical protein